MLERTEEAEWQNSRCGSEYGTVKRPMRYAAVLVPSESLRSLDAPDMEGLYVRPSSRVFRLLPSYLVNNPPLRKRPHNVYVENLLQWLTS